MLQQTQVATVIDYYHRFLQHFPTVESLAEAEEQMVLQLWSGLGYYRRARQMRTAAQAIVASRNGFPKHIEQVLELPGIGRYTAGAITSFAYDHPNPILEANTLRLYARLIGLQSDPRSKSGQDALWTFAAGLLPDRIGQGSGLINQSMMEIGSQVCFPQKPNCEQCPLSKHCTASRQNLQSKIPSTATKPKPTPLTHAAIAIRNLEGKLLFIQNPEGQWWEGLWDFLRVDLSDLVDHDSVRTNSDSAQVAVGLAAPLQSRIRSQIGLQVQSIKYRGVLSHAVTRYRIRLICFEATATPNALARFQTRMTQPRFHWLQLNQVDLPLSSPAKKVIKLIPSD